MKLRILIFISTVLLGVSCSRNTKKIAAEFPEVPVTIGEVSGVSSGIKITASGKLEAVNSAQISTRMMGYITSLPVSVGQQVSKGQLLASINSADLQAKKAQAEAGVLQAQAAYNNAKQDYDRFVVLFEQNSATQKEMDDMTAHFTMAQAGLEAASQMKQEVTAQFSYSDLRAPFSGIVTGTFAKEGDMASPGMPIISMESPSRLQVVAMVAESDIGFINSETEAEVTIKSLGKTMSGQVSEISRSSKNTGGQYIVKIDLEKPDEQVLSGMFANVIFSSELQAGDSDSIRLMIPQKAVISEGQLKGVYVIGDDNTAILRWLRLGKTYGENIEVLSGLSKGERYVLEADGRIFNGSKVRVQ